MAWYSWFSKLVNKAHGPDRPAGAPNRPEETASPSSLTRSAALMLRYGVVSAVGNHREHNEDNYYVPGRQATAGEGVSAAGGELTSSTRDPFNEPFIVADGMGGQQAGEEASRMAVEIIPRALARRLGSDAGESRGEGAGAVRAADPAQRAIRDAVAEANQEILGSSGTVPECSNMGTTVVLAFFRNDRVYVAGIGDSRAYRLRDGHLEQLTQDHSLADALAGAGTISKEEVPHHKYKNVLYRYLGSPDACGGPEDVRVLDARAGDRFLLATDGLTGVVGEGELIRSLTAPGSDPAQVAQALVDQALANGSKDNVTAMVIHVLSGAGSGR